MNALSIPQHVIQSIGWTLIHSLWQGLLIFIVLKIAVRLTQRSDVRYGLGAGALLLMIVTSVTTLFFILDGGSTSGQAFSLIMNTSVSTASSVQPVSFITTALHWIDTNIIWLIRFWMLGFVIGMVRIAAGLWYINRLRNNSHPVHDEWMHMVSNLSQNLNIKRAVAIAEAGITSPMVVGFMKPMILFPFGLLAGLTPEQVETILVHELSHIRRQDYIVNLVQAVVETIFFFNPFVVLISSLIRDERENCCDDMVIAKGISPISYVRTLAQLEASRSSSTLALGISGNKNQLLNRIKRIMENSAKNDWGKGRLVPMALVFLGLICASWLSIGSEAELKDAKTSYLTKISKHTTAVSDTSREDGLKVIKSNKHRFSEPHEEFELPPNFDVDMQIQMDMAMEALDALETLPEIPDMPPMPDFDFAIPEVPDDAWNFAFESSDSLPTTFYYRSDDNGEWAKYEVEFREKFREQFKEFYEKNREQFEKMMNDIEQERRDAAEVVDLDRIKTRAWVPSPGVYVMPRIAIPNDAWGGMEDLNAQLRELENMKAFQMQGQFQLNDQPFKVMTDQMMKQSDFMADMARKTDDYKAEVTEMLIEDGYLKKGERLEGLNINDDSGELTINGHKIKEKDQTKYRALHDKYFQQKYRREGRKQE